MPHVCVRVCVYLCVCVCVCAFHNGVVKYGHTQTAYAPDYRSLACQVMTFTLSRVDFINTLLY